MTVPPPNVTKPLSQKALRELVSDLAGKIGDWSTRSSNCDLPTATCASTTRP